jgi:hypothetical protein
MKSTAEITEEVKLGQWIPASPTGGHVVGPECWSIVFARPARNGHILLESVPGPKR